MHTTRGDPGSVARDDNADVTLLPCSRVQKARRFRFRPYDNRAIKFRHPQRYHRNHSTAIVRQCGAWRTRNRSYSKDCFRYTYLPLIQEKHTNLLVLFCTAKYKIKPVSNYDIGKFLLWEDNEPAIQLPWQWPWRARLYQGQAFCRRQSSNR